MSYQHVLGQLAIAISISESPDMPVLGLTDKHLRDAMAEIARYLLAFGARLIYGGDLRETGFSELLFELVARHRRSTSDDWTGVTNYLAWPVHILQPASALEDAAADLDGTAELVCLKLDGMRMSMAERLQLASRQPTEDEWADGLTSMRRTMLAETNARVILGGRVDRFMGLMPGIGEEALMSLCDGQPLFILGGFGGCARDIAETVGLLAPWAASRSSWPGRPAFAAFSAPDLNNGLTPGENMTLAHTPHVDQAMTLILRGLARLARARP